MLGLQHCCWNSSLFVFLLDRMRLPCFLFLTCFILPLSVLLNCPAHLLFSLGCLPLWCPSSVVLFKAKFGWHISALVWTGHGLFLNDFCCVRNWLCCAALWSGVVGLALVFARLSWALHHGGSPVTSHGLLKWAATSHIKSTPWKALVLLQILLAALSHHTVFIAIFHVFCSGWLRVKPCWMPEALGKGAWLRERCICRRCLKTTHSSQRQRAETSPLLSV